MPDPPPDEELMRLYSGPRYFDHRRLGAAGARDALGYRDYLADAAHIEAKFDRVLSELERHGPPGDLLDVGAGPGLLLSAAERRGWSASGIELNPWAASYARIAVGVRVRQGGFGDAPLEGERFDAVTMMDVLEHFAAPDEAVAEAVRITRSGGLLAVLTPDAGSLVSRLLGGRWPEVLKAPGHLVLFSVTGLRRLLERHGYEVLGCRSVGKTSQLATLLADAAPAAPRVMRPLERLMDGSRLGGRTVAVDPHTKFCLYARLRGSDEGRR